MFESLANSLRGGVPDRLAQTLGADPRDTRRAMEVSLPALIGGLRDKTNEDGGVADLVDLLDGPGGEPIDDVESYIASSDARQGAGILDRVFGDRGETALTSLSKASGLSTRLLARVMSMMAPVATGWLGAKSRQEDFNPTELAAYLDDETNDLDTAGYGKVLALLGGAGAVGAAATAATVGKAAASTPAMPKTPTATQVNDAVKTPSGPKLGAKKTDAPKEVVKIGGGASEPPGTAKSKTVSLGDDRVEVEPEEIGNAPIADDGEGGGGGWLWWAIAALAILAFIVIALSQCGGDEEPETAAVEATVEVESVPAQQIEQEVQAPPVAQSDLDGALSIYGGVVKGEVSGDVAILSGLVPDEATRSAANATALAVEGINSVNNQIQVDVGNPISQVVADQPANLSSLGLLLQEAGLTESLAGNGPFTLFAPVNGAIDGWADLAEIRSDPSRLNEVLRYHVVQGRYTEEDLRSQQLLPTLLAGENINVGLDGAGSIVLNDLVTIGLADVQADNGIIHLVVGPLTPVVAGGLTAPSELGEALELEPIKFGSGSSDIDEASEADLDKVVAYLIENPQPIEIAGHTDDSGPDDLNQTLSEDRAGAVRQYLINNGVPQDDITAVGFGESEPKVPNDTEENKAINRRIEFNLGG